MRAFHQEREKTADGNRIIFFTKPALLSERPKNWGFDVRKSLPDFKYMTFDVVGTLIDFGTIEPAEFTEADYHFTSMASLAYAVAAARN